MNTFQIVGLVVFPLTVIGIILAMFRGWVSRRECLAWTVVMLVACIAIAWPETTSRAAKAIGIGRGADLVSYCGIVVMLIGFWMVYLRLRRVQRDLTLVVRRLAMLEAQDRPPRRRRAINRKRLTPPGRNLAGTRRREVRR